MLPEWLLNSFLPFIPSPVREVGPLHRCPHHLLGRGTCEQFRWDFGQQNMWNVDADATRMGI